MGTVIGQDKDKIDFEGQDQERQKTALEKARGEIASAVGDLTVETKGDQGRMGVLQALMDEIISAQPIKSIEARWEAARQEYIDRNKDNPDALLNLPEITRPYKERLEKIKEMSIGYVQKLASMATGEQLTEEMLLKMRDSVNVKAGTLSDILLDEGNIGAQDAVEYALGRITQTDQSFEKFRNYLYVAFPPGYIDNVMKNGPSHTEGQSSVGWWLVNWLPEEGPRSKTEFVKQLKKDYHLTDNSKQLKAFLKAGCYSGAITPTFASKYVTFNSVNEEQEIAFAYKAQNDLLEKSNEYAKEWTGSNRHIDRLFTLKNILLCIAQVSAGVSVGGTIIAGMFKQGALKDPAKLLELLTKKSVLVGAGVWLAADYARDPKPGMFTSAEVRETEARRSSSKDLNTIINSNTGLNRALTSNGYQGATVFGEYVLQECMREEKEGRVTTLDEPNSDKLNMKGFQEWLVSKAKQENDSTGKYAKFLAKIRGSEKVGFAIVDNGTPWEVKNIDFERVAKAFYVFKIGGVQTESMFNTAITMASGGTPNTGTTTTNV